MNSPVLGPEGDAAKVGSLPQGQPMASLENERETATRDIPFRRIGPRAEPRMPEDLNTLISPVPSQEVPWGAVFAPRESKGHLRNGRE